ncbi:hypothetical protein MTR_2g028420 [Medicago truncatula]|uniref:Uncharacterized protein n=1 Tax=Medicago truncatula TaxID=3880 RepID=G7IFR9_MEDTR|nr:hypothetical protein MTR_2g028420 [Medicago truncatula]
MTNYTEENNMSSSSPPTPTEVTQGSSVFNNFDSMKLKLSDLYERMMALRKIRTHGPGKKLDGNKFDADSSSSGDEKDGTSVFNPINLDFPPVIKCPGCDFDIKVSSLRDYLEDPTYNSDTMICPVCDKNLGEDVIRMVQSSRLPTSPKFQHIRNRWKDGVSINDWELYDKINASWGETKHNPTSDSHFSPSRDNVYVPSSNEFFSDEDTISDASDISDANDIPIGKSSGGAEVLNTRHEEDVQERSNKAAFAQELFMSGGNRNGYFGRYGSDCPYTTGKTLTRSTGPRYKTETIRMIEESTAAPALTTLKREHGARQGKA